MPTSLEQRKTLTRMDRQSVADCMATLMFWYVCITASVGACLPASAHRFKMHFIWNAL